MKKQIILLIAIVSLLFTNTAQAAFSFDIQDSGNEGIFNIVFQTNEDVLLNAYSLGFSYDSSELVFVDYTNTPLTGMFTGGLGTIVNSSPGILSNFYAITFSAIKVSAGTIESLGTLTFDVLPGATKNSFVDLRWNLEDLDFIYNVNGVEYSKALGNLAFGLSSPSIDVGTAVPVPSSILLLCGGLFALLGIRREKQ
ncbi:MAG: PEP-CTERM sorting domain-containing protein [Proteobacteria bacterium]|nr:PEP-CTERM sorting domain-containing protein [Pseudomonadota bacterium]MBU1388831.1 PEP-CTERM sorting domain-containing protein [Pseudomonadota bacterium]MBU1542212.1 PEP-CTERM sorting domain-containing protein [Pseudomonadota bacterium]MBU2480402.1 PEP-CTERM sorting domain-containing protein [Pseudomonadota bacterium]